MEQKISITSARNVTMQLLTNAGVPNSQAETIVESIIYAHRVGKGTHGMGRVPLYLKKIAKGFMSPMTGEKLVKDEPVISVLDAENGFGQVAATQAMHLCINKAKAYGIGVVGVRNSNNFGTAGFVAEQAVKHDQIGIVLGNAGPAIAPTGGITPLLGTNPLGIAFPNPGGDFPITLDMATSAVARGKIRQAAKNNEKISFGWALDNFGQPTDDPHRALEGSMLPMGGYKGYGLSLVIDILAGLLPGAAFGGEVRPLGDLSSYSNYGHLCISINITHFMTIDEWSKKIAELIENIKNSGEDQKVKLPGETSYKNAKNNEEHIYLKDNTVIELEGCMRKIGLEVSWL